MKHDEQTLERAVEETRPKISWALRLAAERMRQLGFTEAYGDPDGPACFLGSIDYSLQKTIGDDTAEAFNLRTDLEEDAQLFLRKEVFGGRGYDDAFSRDSLRQEGWTVRDAIAALEMAADIAEVKGA